MHLPDLVLVLDGVFWKIYPEALRQRAVKVNRVSTIPGVLIQSYATRVKDDHIHNR
jgi:hypothetical protein